MITKSVICSSQTGLRGELGQNILDPDAILMANVKGRKFNIALEVELTPKSSERIIDKFREYESSEYYENVMYFFEASSTFLIYKRRLNEFYASHKIPKHNQKIMLVYHPSYFNRKFSFNDCEIYYEQETGILGSKLGETYE